MKQFKNTLIAVMIASLSLNGCKSFAPITVCGDKQDCDVKAVEKPSDFMFSVGVASVLAGVATAIVLCTKKGNNCNHK